MIMPAKQDRREENGISYLLQGRDPSDHRDFGDVVDAYQALFNSRLLLEAQPHSQARVAIIVETMKQLQQWLRSSPHAEKCVND